MTGDPRGATESAAESPCAPPDRLRRWPWVVLAVLVLVGAGAYLHFRSRPTVIPIPVSPETTYLTVVGLDGQPDYWAAFQKRLGPRPPDKDNALIPLLDIVGNVYGLPNGPERCRQARRLLGMAEFPPTQRQFIPMSSLVPSSPSGAPTVLAIGPAGSDNFKFYSTNKPAFDLAIQASKLSRLFLPAEDRAQDDRIRGFLDIEIAGLAEQLLANAHERLGAKDTRGAWDNAVAGLRLARLLPQLGTRSACEFGYHAESRILNEAPAWLDKNELTASQTRQLIDELRTLPPTPEPEAYIEHLRLETLATVQRMAREGLNAALNYSSKEKGPEPGIDWAPALRLINGTYDQVSQAARQNDVPKKWAQWRQISAQAEQWRKQYHVQRNGPLPRPFVQRENPQITRLREDIAADPAKAIAANVMPMSLDTFLIIGDVNRVRMSVLEIRLALEAFRSQNKKCPRRLAELCPEYFDKVPVDVVTGEPFKYVLKGQEYSLTTGLDESDEASSPQAGAPGSSTKASKPKHR